MLAIINEILTIKDSRIRASVRPTIAESTTHRAHGARGTGLRSPPRVSKLKRRGAPARPFPLLTVRAPCAQEAVLSAIVGRVDARIRLSLNVNISLIIASIAK